MRGWLWLAVLVAAGLGGLDGHGRAAEPGKTEVLRWEGGSKACFLLMFDDGWPSHWQVAVPELVKRKLTATFYVNPAKGEYKATIANWEGENAVWKKGMAYGNHTMTHNGIQDLKDGEWEITECTNVILKIVPGPQKRLISWGQPGVKDWKISKEEYQALLKQNNLIDRPPFNGHGVVYHLKTADSILALADKAIASGGMEYAIAHGVERGPELKYGYQDFWPWNLAQFREVLDALASRRDKNDLWITDHISYHQYAAERDKAKVSVAESTPARIRLALSIPDLDPELYNYPLTLQTAVPASWKRVTVEQGGKKSASLPVQNGVVQYPATAGEITLAPSNE